MNFTIRLQFLYPILDSVTLPRDRIQSHSFTFLIFPQILSIFLIFPQTFLIFFLISTLRVGESLTREDPGYATALSETQFHEAGKIDTVYFPGRKCLKEANI